MENVWKQFSSVHYFEEIELKKTENSGKKTTEIQVQMWKYELCLEQALLY